MPGDSPGSWKSHIAADLCMRQNIRFGHGLQSNGRLWGKTREESGAMWDRCNAAVLAMKKAPFLWVGKGRWRRIRDPNLHRGSALLPLSVHELHASVAPPPLPRPQCVVTGCSGIGRCPGRMRFVTSAVSSQHCFSLNPTLNTLNSVILRLIQCKIQCINDSAADRSLLWCMNTAKKRCRWNSRAI